MSNKGPNAATRTFELPPRLLLRVPVVLLWTSFQLSLTTECNISKLRQRLQANLNSYAEYETILDVCSNVGPNIWLREPKHLTIAGKSVRDKSFDSF